MASRKINPNAKKYANLRKQQAEVNRYLKDARTRLGKDHRVYKATISRLHQFQRKHKQTVQNTLSLTDLKTSDIDMYKELLESIKESTFINPNKYAEHQSNQIEYFREQGWGKTDEEIKSFMEFRNSDIFEDIEQQSVLPSALLDKASEYVESDLSIDDFKNTILLWNKEHINTGKGVDKDVNKFMAFADRYIDAKSEYLGNFDKAVEEYLNTNPSESFFEFLDNF